MKDFHLLLRDQAKEWYWIFIRGNRNCDWISLRHASLYQFQSMTSDFEVMRDIVERKEQYNDTVDEFFHAVVKLRAKLLKPVPEYDFIRIIKRYLKDSIARIVYPMSVYSVDQLRHECYQIEQSFVRKDRVPAQNMNRFQQPTRAPQVHEVELSTEHQREEDYVEYEVEEVRALNQNRNATVASKLVCWNCRGEGHVFMNCTQDPKIFCYRCGLAEHKTINCPNCLKNSKETVNNPGASRSAIQSLEAKVNPFRKPS